MEMDNQLDLFGRLHELGTIPALALVFSMVCTVWLVGGRIRGAFRFRDPTPARDVAFLISGPVCTIFISIVRVAAGGRSYLSGGIDGNFAFIASLDDAVGIGLVGLVCFVAGVGSLMLPAKSSATVAPITYSGTGISQPG